MVVKVKLKDNEDHPHKFTGMLSQFVMTSVSHTVFTSVNLIISFILSSLLLVRS